VLTGQLGPYTLVKKIAVGGMAEIYRAIVPDTEPLRQVAIKVIHPNNSEDPEFVRMLLDEARLAVRLKHPNIVTTYDLGKEKEQYYLVMELVEGIDLFRLEQRSTDLHLSIPVPIAAYVAREVARGLHFAHELADPSGKPLNVVHRDVSPQNVLLSYDGAVKITDFGIAKAEGRSEQTQIGIIKGKYYYMSPEQSAGLPLDRRTDIFACGILLYEMLAGEMLYFDQSVEKLLDKVRKAEVPQLSKRRPDTPPELERIMMRALKRRPEDRYRTGEEMAQALDGFLRRQHPTFSAEEMGKFVEKVQATQPKKRGADEPTAALDLSHAAKLSVSAHDDDNDDRSPSPTMGIDSSQLEQMRALGVRDDNSLLFQSGNLKALLEGKASHKSPLDADAEDNRPATAKGLRPSDHSDVTTHRRLAGRIYEAAPPKAIFPAITPDGESFGLLTEGADLLPTPIELGRVGSAKRRPGSSDQLAAHSQSVAVGDSVTAIAPVGILPPGVERSKRTRRPSSRSAGEVSAEAARPRLSEPKMELLQSDVSYENQASQQDGQGLTMAQSDAFVGQKPKEGPKSGPLPSLRASQKIGKSSGENKALNLVAEPSGQIDIISTEMTHESLEAPADLRASQPPEPSVEVSESRSRWLFALSGLSAAVVSAALTWFLVIGPQRNQRPQPAIEDLTAVADLGSPADLSTPGDMTTASSTERAADTNTSIPAEEKQRPTAGQVLIRSEPPGATVYIDKAEIGVTPLLLTSRPPGEDFKIELKLDGYKKGRKRVKWRDKDRLEIKVKLQSEAEEASSDATSSDSAHKGSEQESP
jgi:serine/threonine protein kinase